MKTNFKEYLAKKNVQKAIDKFAQKYEGKKVVLYGAGLFAGELIRHYDFSKLNIIGVADKRFQYDTEGEFYSYPKFGPLDLLETDFDLVLITTYDDTYVKDYLKQDLLSDKEATFKIKALVRMNLIEYIKALINNEI